MDRVHPLKLETPSTGGTDTDNYPTSMNHNEDYVDARGIVFQNDSSNTETVFIDRDASDSLILYTNNTVRVTVATGGAVTFNDGSNTYTFPTTRPSDTYLLGATDANGTLDWIAPSGGYFELNTTPTPDRIVQPSGTASYDEDFVIGSPNLDHTATSEYFSRMFWDNSSYSFRAGYVTSTQWDTRGNGSVAFGQNTQAQGNYSFVAGLTNTANAPNSFSVGGTNTSVGDYSSTVGSANNARGQLSFAGGSQSVAGGSDNQVNANIFVYGYQVTATGLCTGAFGYNNTYSDSYSIIGGLNGSGSSGGTCNVIGGESNAVVNNSYSLLTGQTNEIENCRYTAVIGADADVFDCDGTIVGGTTNSATYKLGQAHSIMYCNNNFILGVNNEAYDNDYTIQFGYRHAIRQLNNSIVSGELHYYQTSYSRDNSLLIGRYGVIDYTNSFTISPGASTESGDPASTNGNFQTIRTEGFVYKTNIDDVSYTTLTIGHSGETNYILVKPNQVVDYKIKIIAVATSSAGVLTAGDHVIFEVEGACHFDGTTTTLSYTNVTTLYESTALVGDIAISVATTSLGSNRGIYPRALGTASIDGENFTFKTSWKIINSTWS